MEIVFERALNLPQTLQITFHKIEETNNDYYYDCAKLLKQHKYKQKSPRGYTSVNLTFALSALSL